MSLNLVCSRYHWCPVPHPSAQLCLQLCWGSGVGVVRRWTFCARRMLVHLTRRLSPLLLCIRLSQKLSGKLPHSLEVLGSYIPRGSPLPVEEGSQGQVPGCPPSEGQLGTFYSSGPQPFWHQGPVSWKTVFPWTGELGGWFRDDSSALHLLCTLFLLLLHCNI